VPSTDSEIPTHLSDMWIVLTNALNIGAMRQSLSLEEIIMRMSSSGMSKGVIKEALIRDLQEGGQIFGDFRKQFKTTMKWGVEETSRRESLDGLDVNATKWEWLGIGDKSICDNCKDRNAMGIKEWTDWEAMGLPGGGSTICGANCRCRMVIAESVDKPVGGIVLKKL